MPLPLLIAAVPVVAASSDLIIGIVIGVIGGGASTLSLVSLYHWLFTSRSDELDESITPIALIIEKLNAALARMPEYELAQQGFFNISREELKKVLEIEKSSDNLTTSIIEKTESILRTKAILDLLNTFLHEPEVHSTLIQLGEYLTDEHQKILREMQELIQQNQDLRNEIQQNDQLIKQLLCIIESKLINPTEDVVQIILP